MYLYLNINNFDLSRNLLCRSSSNITRNLHIVFNEALIIFNFFRSLKVTVDFNNVCDPQQIISFVKELDIQDLRNDKMKFMTVTILNVVLQQVAINKDKREDIDVLEIIIDVSCNALKLMIDIVKCDNDNISRATVLLCGTCAGSSR